MTCIILQLLFKNTLDSGSAGIEAETIARAFGRGTPQ
jgi:hypothetical protein